MTRRASSGDTRRDFATLDGLRGVAAATVVVYHFPSLWAPLGARSAYLAVDLFFLMSGFIIEHAYGARLAAGLGPKRFLPLRMIRLYPLYVLGTAITAIAIAVTLAAHAYRIEWTTPALVRSLLYAMAMLPAPRLAHTASLFPLNVPAWSLLYEILANLIFATTYRWWTTSRLIAVLIASALGLAYVCWTAGSLDLGSDHGALSCLSGTARVGFSFIGGVLAHRAKWHEGRPVAWIPPPLLLAAALTFLIAFPPQSLRGISDLLRVVLVFPLLLAVAVSVEPRRGRRCYAWLGLTSYAVYAVHEPLLRLMLRIDARVLGGLLERGAPFSGILALAMLFLLAGVADRFYDTPIRRWLTRRLTPRTAI